MKAEQPPGHLLTLLLGIFFSFAHSVLFNASSFFFGSSFFFPSPPPNPLFVSLRTDWFAPPSV